MAALLAFLKREPVFAVALVAAAISVCVVPPSAAYAGYINWAVIITLFCFMLCVAGLRAAGAFDALARAALGRGRSVGVTVGLLVALPFVVSMFVTNDVALIAFVPFACLMLGRAGRPELAAVTVVLQAIAANMGSMLTPFGNPQNLYIYNAFSVEPLAFLQATWAVTALNAGLLALAVGLVALRGRAAFLRQWAPDDAAENAAAATPVAPVARLDAALFTAAFGVCVLAVLRLVPVWAMLVVCLAVAVARDWRLLGKVDWCLLGTFLCFFIFSGNLAAIPAVRDALTGAMDAQPFWIPLLASQVISNVPAAALLTPFSGNWVALLLAVDIGGLGTPIASLASLIALSLYRQMRPEGSDGAGRWMVIFLVLNVLFLALNCAFYVLVCA